jgi:ketosteroid isomerase-like protein
MLASMRCWLLIAMLAPSLAWGQAMTPATDIEAADRGAIRAVIGDQMAAFRRDDATGAFAFAAPDIQAMFGTPEHFLAMVREGYAPVYRPAEVAFGELVRIDGRLTQLVRLVGPDGGPRLALYFMERQPDGNWRISGCVLTTEPGAAT